MSFENGCKLYYVLKLRNNIDGDKQKQTPTKKLLRNLRTGFV